MLLTFHVLVRTVPTIWFRSADPLQARFWAEVQHQKQTKTKEPHYRLSLQKGVVLRRYAVLPNLLLGRFATYLAGSNGIAPHRAFARVDWLPTELRSNRSYHNDLQQNAYASILNSVFHCYATKPGECIVRTWFALRLATDYNISPFPNTSYQLLFA